MKGKPLIRVINGSGCTNTTVLGCVSADGVALPSLIVFEGVAVQVTWITGKAVEGTLYAASSNGWMGEPQFFHWFKSSFIDHVKNVREATEMIDQTAILLYDGHSSHISVRIVEEAITNKICLIKLPSHLTDKLQPLDKYVYGPLKRHLYSKLVDFGNP